VTPASTIAKIQLEYPGMSKVQSAFNKLCVYQWLQKHNNTKQRQGHSPEIDTPILTHHHNRFMALFPGPSG